MLKFGEIIAKHKKLILILALILIIPALIGMKATRINYDILVYLPDEVETIQGEKILSEEFNMGSFSIIIVEDMKTKDIQKLENKIKELDNVEKVVGASDIIGCNIPVEMLPEDLTSKIYKDGETAILVTFKESISSDETMKSIEELRSLTDKQCKISGMSATVLDTRDLSNSEIVIYVVISVALCI